VVPFGRDPIYLKEHCEAFFDESGMEVSEATMSRNILRKLGARTHEALLEAMEEAL
jgi:hypothetical protein